MGSKILSKWSIVIMNKRTRCEKIVEARRQCKERFSMNSLFASNFISLTLFLVIHIEFARRCFSSPTRLVPFYCPLGWFVSAK